MGAIALMLLVSGGLAATDANPVTCATVEGGCFTGAKYKIATLDGVTDPATCCKKCMDTAGCTL